VLIVPACPSALKHRGPASRPEGLHSVIVRRSDGGPTQLPSPLEQRRCRGPHGAARTLTTLSAGDSDSDGDSDAARICSSPGSQVGPALFRVLQT
jgi:hypothetical protein